MSSALVFAIAFGATLLSSMSGAGAAMITIPSWIALGFPLPMALTANQANGVLWTPIAARNYLRGRTVDWKLAGGLVVGGLVGALFGASVVLRADGRILGRVFGALILCVVTIAAVHRRFGAVEVPPTLSRRATAILAVPLGFYEALFGSGNGIFTSFALNKARGFELTTALGYYYFIAFFWNCFSMTIFLRAGFGNLSLILPSAAGSMVGAFLGSKMGRRHGQQLVRRLFILLGAILGVKLLMG